MTEKAGLTNDQGRSKDNFFAALLESKNPGIQEIAWAVRSLIYEILPETIEVVWLKQGSVGYGTGEKKFTEQFAYMMCYKNHVTLGFYHGGDLSDPENLLPRSENKQVGGTLSMRSTKLTSLEDAARPALRALIDESTRYRVPPPRQ